MFGYFFAVYELSYQLTQLTPTNIFQAQISNTRAGNEVNTANHPPPSYSSSSIRVIGEVNELLAYASGGQHNQLPPRPRPHPSSAGAAADRRHVEYDSEIRGGHTGPVYCAEICPGNRLCCPMPCPFFCFC